MANKPFIPVSVIKDDFKYWEYVWPRAALPIGLQWVGQEDYASKAAEENAFLNYHHDKCIQYRDLWEEMGAPWRHAVMVYMLSFQHYKGDRCHVGEWVGQYTNEIIEGMKIVAYSERQLEAQFLRDDLKAYEVKLLEIASNWVRGKMPAAHTSSFVHTGYNVLEKMQRAARVARTLKYVSVMHCWRHSHGELTPGDNDFITQLTFPKWDAE